MGKLAVQKYFSFMMLIATFLLMVFTLVGLFGGDVQPAGNTARAMLVYALPLLIVGNAFFLLYWLIMRRFHWMLMPLITLLCCIPYISTMYKFGSLDEKADKQDVQSRDHRFHGTGYPRRDEASESGHRLLPGV